MVSVPLEKLNWNVSLQFIHLQEWIQILSAERVQRTFSEIKTRLSTSEHKDSIQKLNTKQ